ncbi:hypothetical protein SDC9_125843 [bioreactor metagenome]|uniref:Uncharacterized protein n=1 Tax=bioreactor metagenome TaxID=1076179 RepID=A0A645CPJ8_9ZZZZ
MHRVGVRLHRGARRHAEKAVFRIHGPETAILTHPDPGNVVSHAPGPPAVLGIALGRNDHSQIGFPAGRGKGGGYIANLSFGVLHAQNQHVLGHPALMPAQHGGYAQGKALFPQQNIAAVARIDRQDGVVLREVGDIPVFGVQLRFGMQPLHKIRAVPQLIQNGPAHPCDDGHVQHHVNGIGQLNAVFCIG